MSHRPLPNLPALTIPNFSRSHLAHTTGDSSLALTSPQSDSPKICARCHAPGHSKRKCPQKPNPAYHICKRCGERGHRHRICPLDPEGTCPLCKGWKMHDPRCMMKEPESLEAKEAMAKVQEERRFAERWLESERRRNEALGFQAEIELGEEGTVVRPSNNTSGMEGDGGQNIEETGVITIDYSQVRTRSSAATQRQRSPEKLLPRTYVPPRSRDAVTLHVVDHDGRIEPDLSLALNSVTLCVENDLHLKHGDCILS